MGAIFERGIDSNGFDLHGALLKLVISVSFKALFEAFVGVAVDGKGCGLVEKVGN
ncbi:hypothetical protein IAD21_00304 [Abditibacteriota bacterium]|nr:hypothetical protein IAD21_00304 [Abditibacteriota bacterium]